MATIQQSTFKKFDKFINGLDELERMYLCDTLKFSYNTIIKSVESIFAVNNNIELLIDKLEAKEE